jgi:hypothetical protein
MRLVHHTLNLHRTATNQVIVPIDSLVLDASKRCSLNELLEFLSMVRIDNFQPILINAENQVVEGNKRLLVAIMKGWKTIAVVKEGGYGMIDLDFLCGSEKKVA